MRSGPAHTSALCVQPYPDMCHGTLAEHAVQAGLLDLADEHVAQHEVDRPCLARIRRLRSCRP
jgi:hypothetical protein